VSESEYVIYTARGFKNSGYGKGSEFVWNTGEGFAVKVDDRTIKVNKSL